jgi:hypothetical protein
MRGIYLVALLAACGAQRRPGLGADANGGGDDSQMGNGGGDGGVTEQVYVYAHTASTLFKVDPDTLAITMIGNFGWPSSVGSDQMTDIAIDKTGQMIGVSYTRVYRVDPTNAQATLLSSSLGGAFNGLSFVPAAQLGQTGDDVLVGTENSDGKVYRVDPTTGQITQVGDMGASYASSGDMVAVEGFGTVQTVPGSNGDTLVKLAPNSFAATPIGSGTGFSTLWGIAFWKNKIYGFADTGEFVLIDATTGVGTMVTQTNQAWWGAAVTTLAPVIQ